MIIEQYFVEWSVGHWSYKGENQRIATILDKSITQAVESLPNMHETLSSSPSTAKK
jgi:hypothetical protein